MAEASVDYVLAESPEDLRAYIRRYKETPTLPQFFFQDTESTSLDTTRAKIVGWSISLRTHTAIYCPFGHKIGNNIPLQPCVDILREELGDWTAGYWNGKHDRDILQYECGHVHAKFLDGMEFVYMDDPDRRSKKLKHCAADVGASMEKFETLFTPQELRAWEDDEGVLDISTKAPSRCKDYACADSDIALRIVEKYYYVKDEFAFAVKVDTKLVDVIREMERDGGTELNFGYIDPVIAELEKREEALLQQIYRKVGYEFDVASPKQVGDALFERMGLPSPGLTKGKRPQHITNEDALSKLVDQYPVVEWIMSVRKVSKAKNTYAKKFRRLRELGAKPRFKFHQYAAPTFRFSAPGGDPDVDGGSGVNIQAVSDGEEREMPAVHLKIGTQAERVQLDDDDLLVKEEGPTIIIPPSLLTPDQFMEQVKQMPWVVERGGEGAGHACFRDTCSGCQMNCLGHGIDTTRRVLKDLKMLPSMRQALRAPKGYMLVSGDFDKQEMRIAANYSGERLWLDGIARKDDLHAITAGAAFNTPLVDLKALEKTNKLDYKYKRTIGKNCNFLVLFGGNEYTMYKKYDVPLPIATQIYADLKNNLSALFAWIEKVKAFSRKHGYTTTYFGRRRWLKKYYENPDPKIRAFADRSAVNTAVQGTGADVTRIAMVKVWQAFKEHQIAKDQARTVMQVHDELMYLIREELVGEITPIIKENMEFKVKGWEAQMEADFSKGEIWGMQEDFEVQLPIAA